jgi:hypothetical protein
MDTESQTLELIPYTGGAGELIVADGRARWIR